MEQIKKESHLFELKKRLGLNMSILMKDLKDGDIQFFEDYDIVKWKNYIHINRNGINEKIHIKEVDEITLEQFTDALNINFL